MDHTTSEQELAAGVASHDPIAAFLLQQKVDNATTTKAMEVYVDAKVRTIKFKALLLPPRGGMDRARRHFAECMASSDKLVAALAAERDFLCGYIERQFTPVPKRGQAHAHADLPLHALILLRNMMKMLSHRLKEATARNEAQLALTLAWYGDIFTLVNSLSQQDLALATASVARRAPQPALAAPAHVAQGRRQPRGQERSQAKVETSRRCTLFWRRRGAPHLEGYVFKVPKYAAKWFLPSASAKQAQSIFRANGSAGRNVFRRAFERICRNCWFAGKGHVGHHHSLQASRQLLFHPMPDMRWHSLGARMQRDEVSASALTHIDSH